MSATIEKSQTIAEKSRRLAESVSSIDAVAAATKAIFDDLVGSVDRLKKERNDAEKSADRINAACKHLELAGLFVKKVDHSGTVNFQPLNISRGETDGE